MLSSCYLPETGVGLGHVKSSKIFLCILDINLIAATFKDKPMDILNLTVKQLRQAADLQERIQSLQGQLNKLLGGAPAAAPKAAAPKRGTRRMSAKGRAAIAAAARARWAKYRAAAPTAAPKKPKRKISEAGRARLAALARARWKKAKAAGQTKL